MKRNWSALLLAMCFPSVMAWVYFEALAVPPDVRSAAAAPGFAVLAAYYVAKVVQFGFPILWVWRYEPGRVQFGKPSVRGLTLGAAFGLAVGGALLALYFGALRGSSLLARTPELLRAKLDDFHANTPLQFVLLAVFILAIHSFLEEYYYRWFIFGGLKDHLAVVPAVLVSSLAFMGHHVIVLANYVPLGPTLGFSLCIAIGGAVWAWLYHVSGSLTAPWLSHLLIDTAIMVVGYDLAFLYGR